MIGVQISGAILEEQGVTFGVFMVQPHVLHYTVTAVQARRQISYFLPNIPIILMSIDDKGAVRYAGRKDIVDFLKSVRPEQIPWKRYRIY